MSIDTTIVQDAPSPAAKLPAQPTPQSHAQFRKQKRLSHHAATTTTNKIVDTRPIHNPPTTSPPPPSTISIPLPLTPTRMAPSTTRLLIASIGNPAPYLSTLHSAGHTALHALSQALSLPLQKSSRTWSYGLLAPGAPYTLWASPALMNVSGPAVAAAWRTFLAQAGEGEARLVVLHDELEAPLGQVKVRMGSASAKGHNGLKSLREKMPGVEYVRIGIGIGRPESREPGQVAEYVLRKMSAGERSAIERAAVGPVMGELRRLSRD